MPKPTRLRTDAELPVSIADAGRAFRAGLLTIEALVVALCQRIREINPTLHALITVAEPYALSAASQLDAELRNGKDRGILHGIPIVHKDLYDTAGLLTTMGSRRFSERVPNGDAAVVRRLKDAGTVLLGKASMSEFATHPSGRNCFYGDVHNPFDYNRSAGGSSGGTAAAIAAGLCLGGTGSDTGGSIRIPASWCGIVGLRPTFGIVSMAGAHCRAYSLDVCGPMTRSVHDCALMLNSMVGHDPGYKFSVKAPQTNYASNLSGGVEGLRIGVVEGYTYRDVEPDVADAVRRSARILASLGAHIETVQIPMLAGPLEYGSLFDILLYEFNQVLGEEYRSTKDRERIYGDVVRANLARGESVTSERYERALAEKPRYVSEFRHVFEVVDALLTPTVPMVAPPLDAPDDVWDRTRQFTLPFSFLGVPSITVPAGLSSDGLPTGVQIIADHYEESLLLQVAFALEQATCQKCLS